MFKARTSFVTVGILATALVLSGCSLSDSMPGMYSSDKASTTFNNADVTFAMEMSAHHEQAVEMADIVLAKSGIDAQVISLATAIKAAQGPEIKQMKSWLAEWGQGGMSGMDHGEMSMSESDMESLKKAVGLDAAKLFLVQMTTHHEGAIAMAKTEAEKGKNALAIALAKKIIEAQTIEIAKMAGFLNQL